MISNPKPGQRVQVWYNAKAAPRMPHQGKIGTVTVPGVARPRNHLVDVAGGLVVIPAGNLRPAV